MKTLDIDKINTSAPYHVIASEVQGAYSFVTDSGVFYTIYFVEDEMVRSTESYQFIIANINNQKSPRDTKLKDTILAIVENFFECNEAALLYICETSDGKQRMRSRLFEYWFEAYGQRGMYTMLSTSFKEEDGVENFTSIIMRNTNPDLSKVIREFYETVEKLNQKPSL